MHRSNKKLKYIHFSPIIFVQMVITSGKKDRHSNTRLVKDLVDSGAIESIITKEKAEKLPVKKNKQ